MTTIIQDPTVEINYQEDLYYPKLIDAQKSAKDNPETFQVDTIDYLMDNVKINSLITVCDNNEKFWVIVKAIIEDDGDKFMIGEINNFLLISYDSYNCGDLIVLNYENIYSYTE